jgi:hypothetical protein
MLDAYLDESGIHVGAGVCVIAGYFGGRGQWRKFQRSWLRLLERYEVPREEFHAADLVKKRKFFFHWDKSKQSLFMEEVAVVITEFKIHPIIQGVIVKDFFEFSENQRRFLTGGYLGPDRRLKSSGNPEKPYFMPFQQLIKKVLGYAPVGGRAHFMCGLGTPLAEYASKLIADLEENSSTVSRERIGDLTFPKASETPQLQAADFLSHLTYLHMLERMKTGNWYLRPGPVLETLLQRLQELDDCVFYDKDCIRGALNTIPVQDRGEILTEMQ